MEFNRYLVGTMLFFLSKSYENNLSMFIMFKLREQLEYEGSFKDGLMDGEGTFYYKVNSILLDFLEITQIETITFYYLKPRYF